MNLPAKQILPALFEADIALAKDFAKAEKAPATRRAYRSDFAAFLAWCAERHMEALPATTEAVCGFLASEASRLKTSSLGRRVAAIGYVHKLAGLPIPTDDERVKAVMAGIRRMKGAAPEKKTPATGDMVVAMVQTTGDDDLKGLRDRALLLLGFAGAFRRSELVALDVADLQEVLDGFRIFIRHSKTDQESAGATIAIIRGARSCPVEAVKAWLAASGITEGPIFRPVGKGGKVSPARLSADAVAVVVKDAAERAGFNPAVFSGLSLRSGFLTSAAKRGATIFKMMDVSRHKSMDTLSGYVRDAELFKDHAGDGLL
jgi:integrase